MNNSQYQNGQDFKLQFTGHVTINAETLHAMLAGMTPAIPEKPTASNPQISTTDNRLAYTMRETAEMLGVTLSISPDFTPRTACPSKTLTTLRGLTPTILKRTAAFGACFHEFSKRPANKPKVENHPGQARPLSPWNQGSNNAARWQWLTSQRSRANHRRRVNSRCQFGGGSIAAPLPLRRNRKMVRPKRARRILPLQR